MSRKETIRFLILRTLGNFLVLLALFGVGTTFGPAFLYELQYQVIQVRQVHFTVVLQKTPNKVFKSLGVQKEANLVKGPGFADILIGNREQIMTPIDPLFSILIPKLGIDEQVVPNINPDNPHEYLPVLQHAIAHARGSVFPGDFGTIYLFGHSADNWWDVGRYNAVFYTLNNLTIGDEVILFYENRRYDYMVSQQIISDSQDTTFLTQHYTGRQQLVLQTCWPPGTALKRLYVVAVPKKV